jgi:tRNA threonylcarbamoyladenosine biosynthesis protein TsaB
MILLGIDTCGGLGSVGSIALARLENGALAVLAQTELPGKTYSAQLVPALRSLLTEHKLDAASLEAIVVVNGPGSFTGIRIGVSSAKGLAEALNIPILAVSRLAVLAWKAGTNSAALDAGRHEYYFRNADREILLPAADVPHSAPLAVCEPSASALFPAATLVEPPTAADALQFAVPLLLARDFADPATLDGNYVRRSDAEIFAKAAGKP